MKPASPCVLEEALQDHDADFHDRVLNLDKRKSVARLPGAPTTVYARVHISVTGECM